MRLDKSYFANIVSIAGVEYLRLGVNLWYISEELGLSYRMESIKESLELEKLWNQLTCTD